LDETARTWSKDQPFSGWMGVRWEAPTDKEDLRMAISPRIVARRAIPLALCVAAAAPAAALASTPTGDHVFGLGTNNPPAGDIAAFFLDATSGPSGENAFGFGGFAMPVSDPTTRFTYNAGAVQCLRVSGNIATLVFKIQFSRRLPGDMSTVDAARVYVEDNGFPTTPWKPVDRVRNKLFDSTKHPDLLDCPDPADPATKAFIDQAGPLTSGDTTVIDAQP
jgi:hypothetical protein